jgi:hypothetical protein
VSEHIHTGGSGKNRWKISEERLSKYILNPSKKKKG